MSNMTRAALVCLSAGLSLSAPAYAITPAQRQALEADAIELGDVRVEILLGHTTADGDLHTESVGEVIKVFMDGIAVAVDAFGDLTKIVACMNRRHQIHDLEDFKDELEDTIDHCASAFGREICEDAYGGLVAEVQEDIDSMSGNYSSAECEALVGPL